MHLPGRFQVVPGAVEWILDVAHNEPAAHVLAAQLVRGAAAVRTGGTHFAVIGILGDKDVAAIARGAAAGRSITGSCARCPVPRGCSAAALARAPGARPADGARSPTRWRAGCELARAQARPGDRIVVCGSFHTVGPALQWLRIY